MPAPTLTGPAERLYEFFSPWALDDADNGYGWAWLAAAFGAQHSDVEDVVRTSPNGLPGWVRLFNVTDETDCPDTAVPWVAQFVDATVRVGEDVDLQRSQLRPDANKKATTGAMVASVQTLLEGSKNVRVVERDPTAYQHTLITLTSETPDPAAVAARLLDPTVKAVGHWWTHIVSDEPLISEGTLDIDDVAVDIDDAVLGDIT